MRGSGGRWRRLIRLVGLRDDLAIRRRLSIDRHSRDCGLNSDGGCGSRLSGFGRSLGNGWLHDLSLVVHDCLTGGKHLKFQNQNFGSFSYDTVKSLIEAHGLLFTDPSLKGLQLGVLRYLNSQIFQIKLKKTYSLKVFLGSDRSIEHFAQVRLVFVDSVEFVDLDALRPGRRSWL